MLALCRWMLGGWTPRGRSRRWAACWWTSPIGGDPGRSATSCSLLYGRYQAGEGWARWTTTSLEVDSPAGELEVDIDGEPVVLDTPIEFKIHAGALRVLVPPVPARTRAAVEGQVPGAPPPSVGHGFDA